MKTPLTSLLNQDSDSFNEKLKIAVCSVLGLKFFLLCSLLGGCNDFKRHGVEQKLIIQNDRYRLETDVWHNNEHISQLVATENPTDKWYLIDMNGVSSYSMNDGLWWWLPVINDSVVCAHKERGEEILAAHSAKLRLIEDCN